MKGTQSDSFTARVSSLVGIGVAESLMLKRCFPFRYASAIPPVSMVCSAIFWSAADVVVANSSPYGPLSTTASPGLVQNGPAPITGELARQLPISCRRAVVASGITKIALALPGLPKKGISAGLIQSCENGAESLWQSVLSKEKP